MSLPGRLLPTSQGRVFVHESGKKTKAPPVLLLHGFMLSHYYLRPLIEALAKERRVIALDLLGHGESDRPSTHRYRYDLPAFAETAVEVLDRLEVSEVDLFGHSLGGGVSIMLAGRHPQRVRRLVLACPAIYPLPMPQAAELLKVPLVGERLWKYAMRKSDVMRVMRRDHAKHPGRITADFIDYYWERLERSGSKEATYATLSALMQLAHHDADPSRVTQETLLVWGDDDRVVPLVHGERLAKAMAGARLQILPNTGHLSVLDDPDALVSTVREFLR